MFLFYSDFMFLII